MMPSRRISCASFALLLSLPASAATLYECRGYNGTNFLSNNFCSQSNGVGIRNWNVPDNMTFDQQVQVVEAAKSQERARLDSEIARRNQRASADHASAQNKASRCQAIDAEIAVKDSQLRQPHSGGWGDYLNEERRKLMDQRFALRC